MPVTQIPSRDPMPGDSPSGSSLSRHPSSPNSSSPDSSSAHSSSAHSLSGPVSTAAAEQRDLFEAEHWETAYRGFNPDDVPHLLIQLQDDLSRTRRREALWLSVILHLFVIILLWNSEKLMGLLPHRTVALAIRTDQSKDATFLE